MKFKNIETTLQHVTLNKEVHGDERVKRGALKLQFVAPLNKISSIFDDELLAAQFFNNKGEPRFGSFVSKLRFPVEHCDVQLGTLKFKDCEIKKGLQIMPMVNKMFEVTCTILFYPGDKPCADKLWDMRGDAVKLSIEEKQATLPGMGKDTEEAKKAATA